MDQIDLASSCAFCTIENCSLFDVRDPAWNGDYDVGLKAWCRTGRFLDEVAEHCLAQFKIRDNPVLNRSNGRNRIRSSTEHLFGQLSDSGSSTKNLSASLL